MRDGFLRDKKKGCRTVKHFLSLLPVLALALSFPGAWAQQTVVLTTSESAIDTAPFTSYLRDESGEQTLQDVLDQQFEPLTGPIDFGYTSDKYWLKFSVYNDSNRPVERLFSTSARFMRPLEVFVLRSDGRVEPILANDQYDRFNERPMPRYRFLKAPLRLAVGEQVDVYYRLGAGGRVSMVVQLESESTVLAEQNRAELFNAIFVSILLTLILVNLFHFIAVRRFAYLGYVLYESFNALYVSHVEGFTWQYLWPGLPWLNANATPLIASTGLIVGCVFAMSFLETFRYSRMMHRVLTGLCGVAALCFLVSLVNSRVGNQVSAALLPISMGASVVAAVIAYRKGSYLARYFLVAWGIYFFAALWYSMAVLGLVQNTQYLSILWLYKICIVIQAGIFSMGLADQVRRLNEEHRGTLVDLAHNLEQRLAESRERLKLERENEKSRLALLKKSHLLAATSHDLNQPIQTLRYAVKELEADSGKAGVLDSIGSTVDHLEAVITESLDKASNDLAESTSEYTKQSIVLGATFRQVADAFAATAEAEGTKLRVFNSRIVVVTYLLPLKRCLMNLVANAVDHAEAASVLIGARYRGNQVRIEVRDQGKGIDNDLIPSLLTPLEKSPDSSGHGLGLSIVSSICEEYGWQFDMESQPGKGTTTSITLPIRLGRE